MHGILFDTEPIIAEATNLLQAQAVAERCETIGGDFFQAVPDGGDAYLMKHIIHDWNDEQCITILSNCRSGIPAKLAAQGIEPGTPEFGKGMQTGIQELDTRFGVVYFIDDSRYQEIVKKYGLTV